MKLECTDTKENQLKLLEIKRIVIWIFFLISTEGINIKVRMPSKRDFMNCNM